MYEYNEVPEQKVIEQVLAHMKNLDIEPKFDITLRTDGHLHRYTIHNESSSKKSGAYIIHLDGRPSWFLQDWRTDLKVTGSFRGKMKTLSPEEKRAYTKKKAEEKKAIEARIEALTIRSTRLALSVYSRANSSFTEHQYLTAKNVPSVQGLRVAEGKLLVPLYDIDGNFKSLQYIFPDGKKLFASGTSTSGAFFTIGKISPDKPILLCEGLATGISIHTFTINENGKYNDLPVICAMNCGNLPSVARSLRKKYPNNKIFICADNDTKNEQRLKNGLINATNPGLFYASSIVRDNLADGIIIPSFLDDSKGSDWNDYYCAYGFVNAKKVFLNHLEIADITPLVTVNNPQTTEINHEHTHELITQEKKGMSAVKDDNAPTGNKQDKPKSLDDIKSVLTTAAEILNTEYKPIRWAVPNLIPEGLTVFAGNPKVGKSWCALDLAVTIGIGGYAFGNIEVEKGSTLYLAYEDTQPRIKSRLLAMGITNEDLEDSNITISTQFPKQEEGGLEYIALYLDEHPDTRLVIIDTLEKFRKPTPNRNIYKEEYQTLSEIKAIADKYHVAIMVIHHFNKGMASDWINKVSGTNAIAGAADTIIALQRDRVSDGLTEGMSAVLHITSRMCEERDLALKFENFRWNITGKVEKKHSEDEQLIIDFLKEKGTQGATPKEIAEEISCNYHSLKTRIRKLTLEGITLKLGYGKYVLTELYLNDDNDNKGENDDRQIHIDDANMQEI